MDVSEYDSHSLVEITPNEWKTLCDLYVQRKKDPTGYNLIKILSNWIAKDPQLDIKFFSLDGDWKNDGTFIIFLKTGTLVRYVFSNTLSDNLERLATALLCMSPKPDDNLFYGERLIPAVNEYRKKFGKQQKIHIAWYTVSKEIVDTFSIEPPAGIELRSLEIKDAPTVNEPWPHRVEGSEKFVETLIVHNVSVGAYDAEQNLVAWCLRLPFGALGLLQVLETHKRLGLGSLMVRYLSKKISESGDEVLAPVVTENTPSRKMFEKLGFEKIDDVYWAF